MMNVFDKDRIAVEANMIIRGYAFTEKKEMIEVVNLNQAEPHVMLMTKDGKMLESSMDPIEEQIAFKIWERDSSFMEVEIA